MQKFRRRKSCKDSYFQASSKTVFETQLFQDIRNDIWVSGALLQSRARVYNLKFKTKNSERLSGLQEFARTNDEEWELNEQRVSDAWFLWIIVNYYHSKGKLAETDIKCEYLYGGRHLNIEELCRGKHVGRHLCIGK